MANSNQEPEEDHRCDQCGARIDHEGYCDECDADIVTGSPDFYDRDDEDDYLNDF